MNWDALAAISDLVSAAGVIVSLIYVAGQIRQGTMQTSLNTKAIQATAYQNLLDQHSKISLQIATTPEIRKVLIKARTERLADFNEDERLLYSSYMQQHMRSVYSGFHLRERGLIGEDEWISFATSIDRVAERRAFDDWWQERKNSFPPSFIGAVEARWKSARLT